MTSHLELARLSDLPMQRPDRRSFDPPAELAHVRDEQPLRRMLFPDSHIGWLATGHAEVRAVLADQRISSRYELLHVPYPIADVTELMAAPPGDLSGVDAPRHPPERAWPVRLRVRHPSMPGTASGARGDASRIACPADSVPDDAGRRPGRAGADA
jgi:hypothetical protein